jgi:hypothetical protein
LKSILVRQPRLVIATLNYDNVVETFCEAHEVAYGTGVSDHGRYDPKKGYEFGTVTKGFELIKLHGSLNWGFYPAAPHQAPHRFTLSFGNSVPTFRQYPIERAILFGGANKLTAEGPFLDLLRNFQRELLTSTRLTIVGYSFRDDHVNAQIAMFTTRRPDAKLTIIDPHPPTGGRFFDGLVAALKDRVTLIEKTAAIGLAEMFSDNCRPDTAG